jgi:hypothetical protein
MNSSDNESDSFVDAEEALYDSSGRPLNLRFSAVQLSSANRNRLLSLSNDRCVIPEISVTDTSLNDEAHELSDGPDYNLSGTESVSEDDQTIEVDAASGINKDNSSLTSGKSIQYPSNPVCK